MAAVSIVVNTASGPTAPIQWTDSAGGTVVDWFTPQLEAVTLAGQIKVEIRGLESNAAANAVGYCQIAVVDNDGTNANVYGVGVVVTEFDTSEAAYNIYIAGADISISAGRRIRIRFGIDDEETAGLVTGHTATLYFNGAAAGSGDTYVYFPVTLTELVVTDGAWQARAYAQPMIRGPM